MLVLLYLSNYDGHLMNAITTFYFRTHFQIEKGLHSQLEGFQLGQYSCQHGQ